MKRTTVLCLFLLSTGCATIFPQKNLKKPKMSPFNSALESLLQKSDIKPMQGFIKKNPDSIHIGNAKKALQLHNRHKKSRDNLNACEQQLAASRQDLKKLQEDIDRLTQLNLEMDRKSP